MMAKVKRGAGLRTILTAQGGMAIGGVLSMKWRKRVRTAQLRRSRRTVPAPRENRHNR